MINSLIIYSTITKLSPDHWGLWNVQWLGLSAPGPMIFITGWPDWFWSANLHDSLVKVSPVIINNLHYSYPIRILLLLLFFDILLKPSFIPIKLHEFSMNSWFLLSWNLHCTTKPIQIKSPKPPKIHKFLV